MNTNQLDKIYIGSNEVTKLCKGGVLIWQKESPPVGRTIPITLNSGNTIINGNSLPYESGTTQVQDGDTIIIQGGETDFLQFTNFNLASGKATVKNNGLVEVANGMHVTGVTKNMDFNFYNQDGINEYGIIVYWHQEGTPARVWFDTTNQGNWENVTFRGFNEQLYDDGIGSPIFQFGTNTPLSYNNGAGTLCSDGLTVSHVRLWMDAEEPTFIFQDIIKFPGLPDNDTGHHKNLTIDNIIMDALGEDIETLILARNVENLVISNFELTRYNNDKIPGTFHARLIKIGGNGRIFNVKSTDYYGNIFQIYPLRRIGQSLDWKIHNVIGYDCPMYSLFEAQLDPSNLATGFFESAPIIIYHATAKQLGYSEQFRSDIIDQFNYTGAEVYNSVVDDCYDVGIGTGANNYIYPDVQGVDPNINTTTFVPGSGSPLIGQGGVVPEWASLDYYGNTRPSSGATIGAVEPV